MKYVDIRHTANSTLALTILLILLLLPLFSKSQVTIGSGADANEGSLLDLKENNNAQVNASKGLLLPRVKLIDPDKLKPMYGYTDANDTPTEGDLANHNGLIVFNTNKCNPFGLGVFVWDGERWVGINNMPPLLAPSLQMGVDTLHLPSGMDARLSAAQTLTFDWNNNSPTFTAPQAASSGSMSGGLVFTSPRGWSPASGSWVSSPATLSVWADDMTNALVTSTNPWRTRQSKITFTAPSNECGSSVSKELLLNQTNYAIIVGAANSPVRQVHIKDVNTVNLNVLSNTSWKVAAKANGPSWAVSDVLQSYTSALMDKVSSDGTTGTDYNFTYKGAAAASGKRFSSVALSFQDPMGRAKDFEINIQQCQGTPDMSGVYQAASADETSNGSTAWAGKVVRHPAKTNVYEEFYSAEFGNAGRWMITNLAAKAYDGTTHSASRALTYGANTANSYVQAYWAYPSSTSLTSDVDYKANPFLGYLYTWDAATAGKGGTDGKQNFDRVVNTSWPADRSEAGMQEWNGTGTRPSNTQKRRQGICPRGWHLPSDYEWTQLEREIVASTTKYSNVTGNIDAGNNVELNKVPFASTMTGPDTSGSDAWRGSTHGQAMRDACEINYAGTSKYPQNNGFSILFAGYGGGGVAGDFGSGVMYWSSSIAHGEAAYGRIFNKDNNTVYRYRPHRYYQFPVRCKKD